MFCASGSKVCSSIRHGTRKVQPMVSKVQPMVSNIKNVRYLTYTHLKTQQCKPKGFVPISRTNSAMQWAPMLNTKPTYANSTRNAMGSYRYYSSLPEHELVKLPNLSPTMEAGTIVSWEKAEGDRIEEGEVLALIETDKSTMEMETPQEGYIAKILVPAGTKDIPVNQLIAVIVNEEEDMALFKDFTGEEGSGAAAVVEERSAPPSPPPVVAEAPVAMATGALPEHELVTLPNLSPTMEAGTLVTWEKEVGGRIEEGDVLALIETDKSTMEMETPQEGYLAKILVSAGTKDIPVNQLIAVIVNEEEDVAAFANFTGEEPAAPPPPPPVSESPAATHAAAPPAASATIETPPPPSPTPGRVFASPRARRLAMEKGIDIAMVTGTGPRGRITTANVDSYKKVEVAAPPPPPPPSKVAVPPPPPPPPSPPKVKPTPPPPPPPPPPPGATYTDNELSSMRKTIAKRLTESKQNIPHYYLSVDVTMDEVLQLRKELNEDGGGKYKLSVNDFIIKASALSLLKVPECNSQWMESFIRQFNTVDVSIAVSTEGGLITPIIRNADQKGLVGINQGVRTLAEKARNKTIQPHEFIGGTFSISNLGMYGISNFSAVINPPQSCILAVGGTQERLVADPNCERGFRSSNVMNVTLSCDHRVVDGAVGAQWLKEFRTYLEKPINMLL